MNIWVIRPGALGDTVLTFPLLRSIKSSVRDADITLVGSSPYGEIVPVDFGFMPIDHPDLLWMFQSGQKIETLKVKPCDMAYVILKNPDAVVSNLRRVGVEKILSASPIPIAGFHFVETIHAQLNLPTPPRNPMLKDPCRLWTENLLWLHPGSGGRAKLAPLKLFRALSVAFKQEIGCHIAITLGEADSHIKFSEDWWPWLEETQAEVLENQSLAKICERMRHARFYVGNDSGISHLAAVIGVFSILFFMRTDPLQWAPWAPLDQRIIVDYRNWASGEDKPAWIKSMVDMTLNLTINNNNNTI